MIAPAAAGSKRSLGRPYNPQVFAPRPHGLRVLPAHDPSNLNQVIEVVCHPRGKMLPESHSPELGMLTRTIQIGSGQTHLPKTAKTGGPQCGKRIQ